LGSITSTITFILQAIAVYFFILALDVQMDLEQILVIYPISLFVSALSLIPGGIGIFDGGMVGLLVQFDLEYDIAVTTTILIRFVGTGLFSAIGLICLKIISKKN